METFNTLFGRRLAHTLFSGADLKESIQDALHAVDAAKAYFHRLRSDEEFEHFYDTTVQVADQHTISKSESPDTARRHSAQYEDGSAPHQDQNARAHYRHTYFEACNLPSAELKHRFENQHTPSVVALEQTFLLAANGENCQNEVALLEGSCYT